MASAEVKVKKARKRNFSATEIAVLTEKVEQHISVLQSKLTNSITNKKKIEIWQEITAAVNATGVESRTTAEIREKWKSLHSLAKKEFSGWRKESQRTGGGPPPKSPTEATAKIMELFKEAPSFTGLGGFETEIAVPEGDGDQDAALPDTSAAHEAALPTDAAALVEVVDGDSEEPIVDIMEPKGKKKKRNITHNDVLREQYKALVAKQKNIALKRRKLELEVFLLEQRIKRNEAAAPFATINLSPIQLSVNSFSGSPK